MSQLIVEVGMKLDKSLHYYKKLLKKAGLQQVFKCKTHDLYFTKEKSFNGLSENEIKCRCIRIRNPKKSDKLKEKAAAFTINTAARKKDKTSFFIFTHSLYNSNCAFRNTNFSLSSFIVKIKQIICFYRKLTFSL